MSNFGCISARNRENAGNAEVKNLGNDFVTDTALLRVRLAKRFLSVSRAGTVTVYCEIGGEDLPLRLWVWWKGQVLGF